MQNIYKDIYTLQNNRSYLPTSECSLLISVLCFLAPTCHPALLPSSTITYPSLSMSYQCHESRLWWRCGAGDANPNPIGASPAARDLRQRTSRASTDAHTLVASNMDEPLANLLFKYPGADIILCSHDSHHFLVPKSFIVNNSPILISYPQSPCFSR